MVLASMWSRREAVVVTMSRKSRSNPEKPMYTTAPTSRVNNTPPRLMP